MSVVLLVH